MAVHKGIRVALGAMVVASYVTGLILAAIVGIEIDYRSFLLFLAPPGLSLLVVAVYSSRRGLTGIMAISEVLFGMVALSVSMLLFTYLAIRVAMPLADSKLAAMDTALGLDWRTLTATVDRHPLLAELLWQSYQSFAPQLLILPVLLCLFGEAARAYKMVLGYSLICIVSSIITIWFPALGTYALHGIDRSTLTNINPHYGYFFLEQFNAVREDPAFVFRATQLAGLVTFPSVHAATAVLCAWAAWNVKWLRYLFLGLNVLMAISAVTHGSHYFVDVFAGIAVAGLSIALVQLASARLAQATKSVSLENENIIHAGG